jgi:pimeloyl-ACP methyl ester carboxylesterase
MTEIARGYQSLSTAEARNAFIHTVRAVIDPTGQRVNASDRLYLTSRLPSMIIWGRRDRIIPVEHAHAAHQGMPGSRLEIFDEAGHFPQLYDPPRFAEALEDFLADTQPAELTAETVRELVRNHDPRSAAELARLEQRHPTT